MDKKEEEERKRQQDEKKAEKERKEREEREKKEEQVQCSSYIAKWTVTRVIKQIILYYNPKNDS